MPAEGSAGSIDIAEGAFGVIPNQSKGSGPVCPEPISHGMQVLLHSSREGSMTLSKAAPFCISIPREGLSYESSAANTPRRWRNE